MRQINENNEPHEFLIEKLIRRSSPRPTLYHYTGAGGLLGIATSHLLWATDYRFLNDTTEFTYAVEAFRRAIDRRLSAPGDRYPAVWEDWLDGLRLAQRARVFVVSFCEDGDLLSQWRAYGSVTGYSIGFEGNAINSLAAGLPDAGALLRCVYDRGEQDEIVETAIEHLISRLEEALTAFPGQETAIVYNFGRHFFAQLLITASIFKHPQYAEEREWRFIVRGGLPDWPQSRVSYRVAGDHIVPFVEVPFRNPGLSTLLKEVVVGPSAHGQAACLAARDLLGTMGFGQVAARVSNIPYRQW